MTLITKKGKNVLNRLQNEICHIVPGTWIISRPISVLAQYHYDLKQKQEELDNLKVETELLLESLKKKELDLVIKVAGKKSGK